MTDVKNKTSYDETADEALLQRFFADSARMDIADDGFTDRLMHRLPEEVDARCSRLARLWPAARVAVCGAGVFCDVVHAVQDRVGSFSLSASVSFPPSADWTTLLHTSLMIAIALVVPCSLVLYDLNESA